MCLRRRAPLPPPLLLLFPAVAAAAGAGDLPPPLLSALRELGALNGARMIAAAAARRAEMGQRGDPAGGAGDGQ
eukprot:gene33436-23996_t